jgi:hypothetical protein
MEKFRQLNFPLKAIISSVLSSLPSSSPAEFCQSTVSDLLSCVVIMLAIQQQAIQVEVLCLEGMISGSNVEFIEIKFNDVEQSQKCTEGESK